MKKQNLNNKLAFNKAAVVELNFNEISSVNGGSTPAVPIIIAAEVLVIGVEVGIIVRTLISK